MQCRVITKEIHLFISYQNPPHQQLVIHFFIRKLYMNIYKEYFKMFKFSYKTKNLNKVVQKNLKYIFIMQV